jgi:hypothetical protein
MLDGAGAFEQVAAVLVVCVGFGLLATVLWVSPRRVSRDAIPAD